MKTRKNAELKLNETRDDLMWTLYSYHCASPTKTHKENTHFDCSFGKKNIWFEPFQRKAMPSTVKHNWANWSGSLTQSKWELWLQFKAHFTHQMTSGCMDAFKRILIRIYSVWQQFSVQISYIVEWQWVVVPNICYGLLVHPEGVYAFDLNMVLIEINGSSLQCCFVACSQERRET